MLQTFIWLAAGKRRGLTESSKGLGITTIVIHKPFQTRVWSLMSLDALCWEGEGSGLEIFLKECSDDSRGNQFRNSEIITRLKWSHFQKARRVMKDLECSILTKFCWWLWYSWQLLSSTCSSWWQSLSAGISWKTFKKSIKSSLIPVVNILSDGPNIEI